MERRREDNGPPGKMRRLDDQSASASGPSQLETSSDAAGSPQSGTSRDDPGPSQPGTPMDSASPSQPGTPMDSASPSESGTSRDSASPFQPGSSRDSTSSSNGGEQQPRPVYLPYSIVRHFFFQHRKEMYLPNVRNKPVLPPELRSPQPRTSRDDAGPSQSGTSTDSASSSNGGEQQRKLVMAEVSNLHQFLLKKATTMYTPNLRNQPVLPPELHGLLFPGTSELPSVPTVEVRSRVGQHQRQFHPYLDTRLAGSFDPANLRRLARQDPGSQTDDADAAKTSNLGGANQHQGNPPGRHDDPGNNPDLDRASNS